MFRIGRIWRNITSGIRNLWRWIPIIWEDQDWDWYYIAKVLEFKLLKHAEVEEKYGHHMGIKANAKHMKMCAILLRRLIEDEYWENAQKEFGTNRAASIAAMNQSNNDQKYLGLIIGKYLTHWWD